MIEDITENEKYYCKQVDAKTANDLVKKYHYSHKVVGNSKLHLGIFSKEDDSLAGVLSFGYPMWSEKTPQLLVKNSSKSEMYELNRMAMLDEAPKFVESQAIGLSIKWIKRFQKDVKWLLSYSDGKEGNIGTIYQATNWKYFGYKLSTNSFYEVDGKIIHSVSVYVKYKNIKPANLTRTQFLCTLYKNVAMLHARQYIYMMPLAKKVDFLLDEQPYPKKESEPKIVKKIVYKKNGKVLKQKQVIDYLNK